MRILRLRGKESGNFARARTRQFAQEAYPIPPGGGECFPYLWAGSLFRFFCLPSMSGLCGCIHVDGRPGAGSVRSILAAAASHRGPDGIRSWEGADASLAHLALNVTPEDMQGEQPVVNEELILVADARIDNRDELWARLGGRRSRGCTTDADLILAAYRRWGDQCAQHLIGDFAFAIWNDEEKSLFAARDPMAMRAFYYRSEPDRFLFASEIQQLLDAPAVPVRINEAMVAAFLAGRMIELEHTFYEGISALPPGHALRVGREGARTWRYWDVDPDRRITYDDEQDYIDHFRQLFERAVGDRLRSVKPVGLYLSGGLDSASVAAMGGWLHQNDPASDLAPLRTYSWAFSSLRQCDERGISDHIRRAYALPSTPIDVERIPLLNPSPAGRPDRDGPFMGAFQALLHAGAAAAREEGVGCMMTGHRGDLMAGEYIYDYAEQALEGRWAHLWADLRAHRNYTGESVASLGRRHLLAPLQQQIWPRSRWPNVRKTVRAWKHTLRPPVSPYPAWVTPALAHHADTHSLFPPDVPPRIQGPARRRRYAAATMPIHMHVATWFERLCAQNGLSYADPWSDRRLLSFVMAVPPGVLCRAGQNKRITREAMRSIMPEAARRGAGKTDPNPLYQRSLKEHRKDLIEAVLCDPMSEDFGYVDAPALRAYYQRYRNGTVEEDSRFWHALTLELWLRTYFSQSDTVRL